jgi:hypothetical protein
VNKDGNDFDDTDLRWVAAFADLLSNYVNYLTLARVVEHGKVTLEMDKWISPTERGRFQRPARVEPFTEASTLAFFAGEAADWAGTFQIVFHAFEAMHLLETFQITNDKLFMLVYRVRRFYRDDVPYHGWAKAVDMIQAVLCQIVRGNLAAVFTGTELLALFTACLFAFAGHDGTTNEFQARAKTPIGLLYREDALTTTACQIAVNILAKPQYNIFAVIPQADRPQLWSCVLQLMHGADTGSQERLLHESLKVVKAAVFDLTEERHRMLLMLIMMKAASLAPFARPFAILMKWQAMMMSENFWLGDAEVKHGLEFASRHNSRDHHHKEQAQIELITQFAIPIFEVQVQMVPALKGFIEAAQDNLLKWKARL